MTATITEIEIGMMEKQIPSIKCDMYEENCNADAKWLLIKGCGCDVPLCEPHKWVLEQKIEVYIAAAHDFRCLRCNHWHKWTRGHYRWEPL